MHVDFSQLNLQIGNEKIERIGDDCKDNFFKFVGIRLDEHLTWSHQINHIHSKLASGNYAISQTKIFLPKKNTINHLQQFISFSHGVWYSSMGWDKCIKIR